MTTTRATNFVRDNILAHLIALPVTDRYMRFCSNLTDDSIEAYVNKLDFTSFLFGRGDDTDAGYIIWENVSTVAGFVHIAVSSVNGELVAELGLSVSAECRGKRYGSLLFERGLTYCKSRGIKKIYMNCLAANTAMQKIARSHGVKVVTSYGESVAAIDLSDSNAVAALIAEASADSIGVYDLSCKYFERQWKQFIAVVTAGLTGCPPT